MAPVRWAPRTLTTLHKIRPSVAKAQGSLTNDNDQDKNKMRRALPPKARASVALLASAGPVTRSSSGVVPSNPDAEPKAKAERRVKFHPAGESGRVLCMTREFEIDSEGGCYMNHEKSRETYDKKMTKKVPGPVPGSYEPKLCRTADENDARFANLTDANDVSQINQCIQPQSLEWARHAHDLACRFERHRCADSVRFLLTRMELSKNAWCRGEWEATVRDALIEDKLDSAARTQKRKFVVT